MIARDAVEMPGEGRPLPLPPPRQTEVAERRHEDLPVVGRHQVIEDRVDRGAHVEQDVGHHVEVVVEVKKKAEKYQKGDHFIKGCLTL